MTKCALCGKEISNLDSYHCKFCRKEFCRPHRLPENHSCWEAKMYKQFSDEMRSQGRGKIFGANEEAVLKDFRGWLEGKRKRK